MNSGFALIHKILKDETRCKILFLIDENQSVSYTELMDRLEVISTGLLNYHLKVLDDLISKNEEDKYVLSEKGQLALRLLNAFPSEKTLGRPPKWWRKFWVAHILVDCTAFIILMATYLLGFASLATVYNGLLIIFMAIGIGYMITHITKDVMSEKGVKKIHRMIYLFAGAFIFGFILWIGFMSLLHSSRLDVQISRNFGLVTFDVIQITSVVLCYSVGGLFLDFIGKLIDYPLPSFP